MPGLSVPDWLARRAALTPDRVALEDAATGRALTFLDLNARTNRRARHLRDVDGIRPGDRVAVLAHNSIAYLEVWLACQKLGAILQNLNWRLHPEELRALVDDAAPSVLYVDHAHEAAARDLGPPPAPLADPPEGDDGDLGPPPVGPDAPWVICYTGGSTGRPKGALLTQGNVLFNAINTVIGWGLDADDVAILNAPLFHTGGLNVFTAPLLYAGGRSVVCARFEPEQVFDLVARGATLFFGVPTMFQALQAHPRWATADLSTAKLVISGGAPCPPPVFQRFFDKGVAFRTGYGLTEAGPNNFWLPAPRVRAKPGVVGQPLFHVEARLVDEAGAVVEGPGRAGALELRGPHVIPGYYRDEAASRAAIDPSGWLRTGDLAIRDADGDYAICGREKELIISGGENVYPSEIESVLFAHPGVLEAAVVGVPHEKWGEVPVAVVVRQGDLTDRELLDFCAGRLARYKIPRAVHFWSALPRTGPGKVDKRSIAARVTRA